MLKQVDTFSEILALYTDGPAQLEAARNGLTEIDLDLTPSADSWSIRQIIHHIVDGDDIWKICIKAALGNSDALLSLQWYTFKSQMEWSESWAYSRSLASSLALYRANRAHIVDLLEHIPARSKSLSALTGRGRKNCASPFSMWWNCTCDISKNTSRASKPSSSRTTFEVTS